jgi:hypothetical protein
MENRRCLDTFPQGTIRPSSKFSLRISAPFKFLKPHIMQAKPQLNQAAMPDVGCLLLVFVNPGM